MSKAGGLTILPPSANGNDPSYGRQYGMRKPSLPGAVNGVPYGGDPYGAARPPQTSPPGSQHPSSSTDMSRPSQAGSSSVGRAPSSASSIASNGRMGYPPRDSARNSSRSALSPQNEEALQRHYGALRNYLAASLQDDKGNMRPNRARDKLLRLSVTQFMELSTDVYDELIRREDERLQRMPNVPRSLPPKDNFHPKRNQARQKLSTLPIDRFRQLATDVFYELERRIPRLAGGDIGRAPSSASNRAPSRGAMRPPPPGQGWPPHPPMGGRPPMSPVGPGPNGMGPPRPMPRQPRENTMVPNKSTMVEDDYPEEDDEFGLDNVVTGLARRDTNLNGEDQEKLRAQEAEIEDLKAKLLEKEQELSKFKSSSQEDMSQLREELEQKHMDAQKLNDDLRRELDQLHKAKREDEREVRAQHDRNMDDLRAQLENAHKQTDDLHSQLETHQNEGRELRMQLQQQQDQPHQPSDGEYERRIELLQQELSNQERITKEVRDEATMLLHEMRDLSKQNDQAIEQEEKLATRVSTLEKEIEEWRKRYAKVKSQNKSLRASHMGLGLQNSFDAGSLLRKEALVSEHGLVKDVDVTQYQICIEELLKTARQSDTKAMLDTVKGVAVCVQSITTVVGTDGYPTPSSPLSQEGSSAQPASASKLKARVTGTANSLITQTKLHASASGLSPVALLDAAASNLTAAVVELVKAVGIRPSPKSELEDIQADYHEIQNHHHESHGNYNESMGSFYEDQNSPNDDYQDYYDEDPLTPNGRSDGSPLHITVSAPDSNAESVQAGSVGRNNTFKKMNDWFGWGSKGNTPEPPSTPISNGHTDYDPYR